MKLSKDKYNKIKQWMYQNARPLDFLRWQYHFENGSAQAVVDVLKAYQNDDGGFGYGIEADCLNPNSSPLQTWWAIQFIKEIELDKDHFMIKDILKFLNTRKGMSNNLWQFSIESNNDYPRAPWWTHSEVDLNPGFNPTAALLGFILFYDEDKSDLYKSSIKQAEEVLQIYMARDELTEMHELACFIELYEYLLKLPQLNIIDMNEFSKKLIGEVFETIEHDSSKWAKEYCCKPSHLFRTPHSFLYTSNKESIDDELEFIVDTLSDEGTWDVTWSWGNYLEEFNISKRWWQGNIAIWNVKMLKDFE